MSRLSYSEIRDGMGGGEEEDAALEGASPHGNTESGNATVMRRPRRFTRRQEEMRRRAENAQQAAAAGVGVGKTSPEHSMGSVASATSLDSYSYRGLADEGDANNGEADEELSLQPGTEIGTADCNDRQSQQHSPSTTSSSNSAKKKKRKRNLSSPTSTEPALDAVAEETSTPEVLGNGSTSPGNVATVTLKNGRMKEREEAELIARTRVRTADIILETVPIGKRRTSRRSALKPADATADGGATPSSVDNDSSNGGTGEDTTEKKKKKKKKKKTGEEEENAGIAANDGLKDAGDGTEDSLPGLNGGGASDGSGPSSPPSEEESAVVLVDPDEDNEKDKGDGEVEVVVAVPNGERSGKRRRVGETNTGERDGQMKEKDGDEEGMLVMIGKPSPVSVRKLASTRLSSWAQKFTEPRVYVPPAVPAIEPINDDYLAEFGRTYADVKERRSRRSKDADGVGKGRRKGKSKCKSKGTDVVAENNETQERSAAIRQEETCSTVEVSSTKERSSSSTSQENDGVRESSSATPEPSTQEYSTQDIIQQSTDDDDEDGDDDEEDEESSSDTGSDNDSEADSVLSFSGAEEDMANREGGGAAGGEGDGAGNTPGGGRLPRKHGIVAISLPYDTCKEDKLTEIFTKYGEVKAVWLMPSWNGQRLSGNAQVYFATAKGAEAALKATPIIINRREVFIREACVLSHPLAAGDARLPPGAAIPRDCTFQMRKGVLARYFVDPDDEARRAPRKAPCTNCGQAGHPSDKCPSAVALCILCGTYGHGEDECPKVCCGNCFEVGHKTEDCPADDAAVAVPVCSVCGRYGHNHAACPVAADHVSAQKGFSCINCRDADHTSCGPAMLIVFGNDTGTANTCYNCGKRNHDEGEICMGPSQELILSSYNFTSSSDASRLRKKVVCHNCNKPGHTRQDCPTKKQHRRPGRYSTGSGGLQRSRTYEQARTEWHAEWSPSNHNAAYGQQLQQHVQYGGGFGSYGSSPIDQNQGLPPPPPPPPPFSASSPFGFSTGVMGVGMAGLGGGGTLSRAQSLPSTPTGYALGATINLPQSDGGRYSSQGSPYPTSAETSGGHSLGAASRYNNNSYQSPYSYSTRTAGGQGSGGSGNPSHHDSSQPYRYDHGTTSTSSRRKDDTRGSRNRGSSGGSRRDSYGSGSRDDDNGKYDRRDSDRRNRGSKTENSSGSYRGSRDSYDDRRGGGGGTGGGSRNSDRHGDGGGGRSSVRSRDSHRHSNVVTLPMSPPYTPQSTGGGYSDARSGSGRREGGGGRGGSGARYTNTIEYGY